MKTAGINNIVKSGTLKQAKGNPAFCGGYTISREVSKQITENSAKFAKILTKLGQNDGEILNIIVTAIGTAFVAPFFIAFNPLSKEDKETKIYSALRQPISAVIAVAAQLGIVSKFNNWLNNLASTDQIDRMKLGVKPRDSYLKKLIKLENPTWTKAEVNEEIKSRLDKIFRTTVEKERVRLKSATINYEDLITSSFYKSAQDQIKEEFKDVLKTMSKKDAKKFLGDKTTQKAADNIREMLLKEARVKHQLSRLKGETNIQSAIAKLQKQLASATNPGDIETIKASIAKLKSGISMDQIKNHGEKFQDVLQSVKIKQLVKTQINNAEDVLKSTKKYGGIILSLLTLPITCGILNWAYPRIMEKLMPDVANKKKAKEANK